MLWWSISTFNIVVCIALRKKSQRQTCLGSGNVSEQDMSHGWTCLGCLELLLYKKKLRRRKIISGPGFYRHFGAGLVAGPDLYKDFGLEVSKSFRAGNVWRPKVSKSLGLEVSHGWTWFAAEWVLNLFLLLKFHWINKIIKIRWFWS